MCVKVVKVIARKVMIAEKKKKFRVLTAGV